MGQGHGHGHGVGRTADRRWLAAALALILAFMAVEFVVGLLAGSLALISDAAHMLTDAAAIGLALVAIRLAARPAQGGYTYGLRRAEILSAQANGITLLLLAAWFCYEGVRRLIDPPAVEGGLVLVTALVGIVVNVAATWCVSRADRTSLNVEGAFQHILNDLYAFIATAIAGLVVLTTGFARADAIAALIVAGLMVKAGWALLRESGRVFLEAAHAGSTPTGSGPTSRWSKASPRCTTCTSGRSPRASPRCPRTCSCGPTSTATPPAWPWSRCSAPTPSRTRRCRSTTRASERSTARTPTARCTGLRRGSCAPSRRCTAGAAARSSWWGR